jgi:hypothetical protein
MLPYLLLFASFLMLYFILEISTANRTLSYTTRWVSIVPLAFFSVTYAGHIGSDVESYDNFFKIAEDFPTEPGFSVLMIVAKSVGLSYKDFMKALAVIDMLLLASIISRLRDPLFFVLFYTSSFYLNFQFNAVRNSLALLIIAALYVRSQRQGLNAIMVSTCIHYSSPITLALQRFASSRHQMLQIWIAGITSVLVFFLWSNPAILSNPLWDIFFYKGHFFSEAETKAIYPALLIKLIVVGLLYRNGGNRFYFITFAMAVGLVHLTSPIFSRVCDLILFLAVLDFCSLNRLVRYRLLAIGFTLLLTLSSLLIPWSDCANDGIGHWCLSGTNTQ